MGYPHVDLESIRSPRYDHNIDREGYGSDGKDNCLICGKIMEESRYWVRMTVFGEIVKPDEVIEERYDQGCFAIGASCLRRHPELREYVVVEARGTPQ